MKKLLWYFGYYRTIQPLISDRLFVIFKTHRQVVSQKFLDLWVEFTEEKESKWVTTKRIKQ